jgi:RNA polymerase-associated protein CTR9
MPSQEEKYLKLAMDFYFKVLQQDPSNIYAANGVGIVFAEKGKLHEAKDFFIQVII